MAGGLFGTPLYLNPKCLIFSAIIIVVWLLPIPVDMLHKLVMGFLLATSAYILMAWYDVIYDCNDRLRPTLLGWISKSFKPAYYQDEYEQLPVKYKKVIRTFDIAILGILVLAVVYPFLVNH